MEEYMKRALYLAEKGRGRTAPNPVVGAIIVKEGRIIGEGYHSYFGGPHAEVNAFSSAEEDVRGATLYVTLEPCSHTGKTPPCADLIIKKGIQTVVVGTRDCNPLVSGKGIEKLKNAGIRVVEGILEEECKKSNEIFFHYILNKTPFVVWKYAMTLDGKIACHTGDSKWVTGEQSRLAVQEMRNGLTAVMTGVNTVLADNPRLTCRLDGGRNPVRIIMDSQLKSPVQANVFCCEKQGECIVVTAGDYSWEKAEMLRKKGVEVLEAPDGYGRVDLQSAMKQLGQKGIDSILLESGGTLSYEMLRANFIQKAAIFIAPKLVGGRDAKTPLEGDGVDKMEQAYELINKQMTVIGGDILITAYIGRKEEGECSQD